MQMNVIFIRAMANHGLITSGIGEGKLRHKSGEAIPGRLVILQVQRGRRCRKYDGKCGSLSSGE